MPSPPRPAPSSRRAPPTAAGSFPWPPRTPQVRHCWPSSHGRNCRSPSSGPTSPRWRTSSSPSPEGHCAMRDQSKAPSRVRPALMELTILRLREFMREPEAMFWVFGFPLLLALGLGIAFRNRPPEAVRIGVVQAAPAELIASLEEAAGLVVVRLADSSAGAHALRTAEVALVVAPGP